VFSWISEIAAGDLELRIVAALAGITLVVTLGLMLQVLALRARSTRLRAEQAEVVKRWRPLLLLAAVGDDEAKVVLPPLSRREQAPFLLLWNQMQDGLRGRAHAGLNTLASRLGLHDIARRYAAHGSGGERLLGLNTLGHLARSDDWERLAALLDEPRSFISLAAARALLQIDALAAAPLVLDQFLARSDWPVPRLGTLLREAGADAIGFALAQRLLETDPAQQVRLLPLARVTEAPGRGSVIEAVLAIATDRSVLAAALQQVHGPASHARVRELAGHADPQVRSYAALALGRIGSAADLPTLVELLSDRDWWVRYRAAQALQHLPGAGSGVLDTLRSQVDDAYARDMIDQVIAERAYQGVAA
jgi:hypothetical protein